MSPYLVWIGGKIYGVPYNNMDSQRLFDILYEYVFVFFFVPVLLTCRSKFLLWNLYPFTRPAMNPCHRIQETGPSRCPNIAERPDCTLHQHRPEQQL